MEERGKGMADLCLLQKWHSAVAAERQMEVTGLEDQKFVVGCAETFLQRDALQLFLVFCLPEADASGLPPAALQKVWGTRQSLRKHQGEVGILNRHLGLMHCLST